MTRLFLFLLILLCAPLSKGASVTLIWDASPDVSVIGYRIYYGRASGVYTNSLTVGNVTSTAVSNLNYNSTYYFAAVARDSTGAESAFSNEVTYSVPPFITNSPPSISFINNQTINKNAISPKIPFTVYDPDSPITNLVVSYTFSNSNIFNNSSFLFVGAGTNRNLYLTPTTNQIGSSLITLRVTDNFSNQVSTSFTVNVINPQNLVYVVSRLEYGTNLTNIQKTNVLLKIFTNPPPNQFYRQYLVITNNF